jgi:hypothetical protein
MSSIRFRRIKNDSPIQLAKHFSREKLQFLIEKFDEISKEKPKLKELCDELKKASEKALNLQN